MTDRDETLFALGRTIVDDRQGFAGEDGLGARHVQPAMRERSVALPAIELDGRWLSLLQKFAPSIAWR